MNKCPNKCVLDMRCNVMKFCPECGAMLINDYTELHCHNCDWDIVRKGDKHCGNCGFELMK
ncbi:unnamed protein product [marine sediment metagenome]|uniref:Putative zinc-ribbon domain-containing protein n=1 Tax=marine sediment metagenome TaxID=412755 RepID=X1B2X4_9ZZZZ